MFRKPQVQEFAAKEILEIVLSAPFQGEVALPVWARGLNLPVRESITDISYLDALTILIAALASSATGLVAGVDDSSA